jgi:hypothetical protein
LKVTGAYVGDENGTYAPSTMAHRLLLHHQTKWIYSLIPGLPVLRRKPSRKILILIKNLFLWGSLRPNESMYNAEIFRVDLSIIILSTINFSNLYHALTKSYESPKLSKILFFCLYFAIYKIRTAQCGIVKIIVKL